MTQKYPSKRVWSPRSHLPSCCVSRVGIVKKRFEDKPQQDGMEAYQCRRGVGWHLRKKR